MKNDLEIMFEFKMAVVELTKKGNNTTSLEGVPGATYTRVSIMIDGVKYYADHEDAMVATIKLNNEL